MLMIKNIDLYVQIPGLSRTSTQLPGLSRPGIQIFKFQDFPGFQGPVQTLYHHHHQSITVPLLLFLAICLVSQGIINNAF